MSYIFVNGLYVNNSVVAATHMSVQDGYVSPEAYQIAFVGIKQQDEVIGAQTVETKDVECQQSETEQETKEVECQQSKTEETKEVGCQQIKTEQTVDKEALIVCQQSETEEETVGVEAVVVETKEEESVYQQIKTEVIVKEEEMENTSETDEPPQQLPTSKYRKYACDLCPKRFKQRYALYDHREEAHDRKLVDCVTCGKSFASKCTLKRHNKRFHSQSLVEAFPYACEICHQRFNSIKKHHDHRTLHTDPDAFLCRECGKRFGNSFALTRHSTRHTSERQVCKTCKRSYKTVEDLQKHVGIHTGKYWCDVCSKVFPSKGNLTMHKKTHLKEHAYCCRFCGQCFRCNLVRFGHEKLCGKVVGKEPETSLS